MGTCEWQGLVFNDLFKSFDYNQFIICHVAADDVRRGAELIYLYTIEGRLRRRAGRSASGGRIKRSDQTDEFNIGNRASLQHDVEKDETRKSRCLGWDGMGWEGELKRREEIKMEMEMEKRVYKSRVDFRIPTPFTVTLFVDSFSHRQLIN